MIVNKTNEMKLLSKILLHLMIIGILVDMAVHPNGIVLPVYQIILLGLCMYGILYFYKVQNNK